MARLNKNLSGTQITDEIINRTSSTSLGLDHDTIMKTGFEIWTGAGGTGTQLTLTTDYTLGSEDSALSSEAGDTIYTKVAIVNGAYHSTALYVSYKTIGDYMTADSVQEAYGAPSTDVKPWANDKTYTTIGDPVLRFGMQFVNINSSNTGNDPFTSPTKWMAVPTGRELFALSNSGRIIFGDSSPQHDYSNAAYAQYFKAGLHRFSGGGTYQAYLVHLDGSAVGSGDLSTAIEAWHLKDAFAPGAPGSRTLVDGRNCVARAVSASGGLNPTIGARLEDAFQGHAIAVKAVSFPGGAGASGTLYSPNGTESPEKGIISTDGINGTPRTAAETRVKSIAVGVPYFYVLVAV